MRSRSIVLVASIICQIFFATATAAENKNDRSILIGLYIGDLAENPTLDKVSLFSLDAFPQLNVLKKRMESGQDLASSVIDSVLDVSGLKKVDNMGFYDKRWPDKKGTIDYFVTPGEIGWLFSGKPKVISPERLLMRLKISMFSDIPNLKGEKREENYKEIIEKFNQKKPENVLEKEISLDLFEPVLISLPYKNRVLIIFLSWTNSLLTSPPSELSKQKELKKEDSVRAPKPLHQIVPLYPHELRQIQGDVDLRLAIDPKGDVKSVRIEKSLHPYLDYSAAKALLQWKFTPVYSDGKPVPATFTFTYSFNPLKYDTKETAPDIENAPSSELNTILERCSESVRKLTSSAPYFVCQEDIREKHRFMTPTEKPDLLRMESEFDLQTLSGPSRNFKTYSTYRVNFSERMERNRFLNEYQILGKDDQIWERRLLIEKNGRKEKDATVQWDKKHFSILNPFLMAMKLTATDSRSSFSYRLIGQERIMGQAAYVIQAMPRSGDSGFIEDARIWIEKDKYRILKIEITGIPFDGYDDVWQEAAAFNFLPKSTITYLFEVENQGIRYPSQTTVNIQYPMPDPIRVIDKIIMETVYKKHKFFLVETEHQIK